MLKSKLSILASFLIALSLIISAIIFLSTQAMKKIEEGDLFSSGGELSQALKSYQQAQKLWPLFYYDKRVNFKINQTKEKLEIIKKNPVATIFLKDNATDLEIESLIQEIKAMNGVKEVKFISKEEALRQYKETFPEVLELELTSILPASIQVYLIDFSNVSLKNKIIQIAQDKPFVDEII